MPQSSSMHRVESQAHFRASRISSRHGSLRALAIGASLAFVAALATPQICFRLLESEGIEPKALGPQTPAHFGVPYEDVRLQANGRLLHGRLVRAPGSTAPAALIFHGNGESVSDWAQAQAQLRAHGMSSMVFDYSGFGASSGSPTVENLRQDAVAAMAHWIELTPEASKRVMIGHSLGNAVMLEAAKSMQKPLPMVIHAGFTSAREIAVETGLLHPMLSSLLAPWLPDLWNNEQTLSALNSKVLIVHGDRDEVVPPDMATRLAKAAGDKARLQIQPGVGHDDIFLQASDADWGPVVQWALEATQEDTTVRNSSSP